MSKDILENTSLLTDLVDKKFQEAIEEIIKMRNLISNLNNRMSLMEDIGNTKDACAVATYVWIADGRIRSKDRTLDFDTKTSFHIEDIPRWSFDGYSTNLASINRSDILLIPRRIYRNPFKKGRSILVLCDTCYYTNEPTESNTRHVCVEVCDKTKNAGALFGIEQEYYLIDESEERRPSNITKGLHYCGTGLKYRSLVDRHYRYCLYAGINIYGTNAENGLNQWEFQVGPSDGLRVSDDLWIARFILLLLGEEYGVTVSFEIIPQGERFAREPTSGGHVNFSTLEMREEHGIDKINLAIRKLSLHHKESIQEYDNNGGADNAKRLVGNGETSNIDKFTHGTGDRTCSVRIPIQVENNQKGYLEDRRPASDCDPYRVISSILRIVLLNE